MLRERKIATALLTRSGLARTVSWGLVSQHRIDTQKQGLCRPGQTVGALRIAAMAFARLQGFTTMNTTKDAAWVAWMDPTVFATITSVPCSIITSILIGQELATAVDDVPSSATYFSKLRRGVTDCVSWSRDCLMHLSRPLTFTGQAGKATSVSRNSLVIAPTDSGPATSVHSGPKVCFMCFQFAVSPPGWLVSNVMVGVCSRTEARKTTVEMLVCLVGALSSSHRTTKFTLPVQVPACVPKTLPLHQ